MTGVTTTHDPNEIRAQLDRRLDREGMADLLRCSPEAVEKRHERGTIPKARRLPGDNRNWWDEGEVLGWLADHLLGPGRDGHVTVGTRTVSRTPDGAIAVFERAGHDHG